MRFTNLLFATIVAGAIALPQRGPGGDGQSVQAQGRNGRPGRRPKGRPVNVIQEPPSSGAEPPPVQPTITPPDDQQGNNDVPPNNQEGNNNVPPNDQEGNIDTPPNDQEGNNNEDDAGQGAGNNQGNNGNQTGNNNNAGGNGAFDASLVPEFGVEAGQQPDGRGNCVGNNGVLIPCECPPDRDVFVQLVQEAAAAGNSEGVPISFPTGNSNEDARARIGASIVVLQNLNGRGVGCPAAATTFLQQQADLE